jgi:hypothetical protein
MAYWHYVVYLPSAVISPNHAIFELCFKVFYKGFDIVSNNGFPTQAKD